MCVHWALARGTLHPPSNPRHPTPRRDSGERAGRLAPRLPGGALMPERRTVRAADHVSSAGLDGQPAAVAAIGWHGRVGPDTLLPAPRSRDRPGRGGIR